MLRQRGRETYPGEKDSERARGTHLGRDQDRGDDDRHNDPPPTRTEELTVIVLAASLLGAGLCNPMKPSGQP